MKTKITILLLLSALIACSPAKNYSSTPADIPLFLNQPIKGWQIGADNPDSSITLTGDSALVPNVAGSSAPNSYVSVARSEKSQKNDALTFSWKDTWRAGLTFTNTTPIDLRSYINGVVAFDFKVDELSKGGVAFKLNCGKNCERQVPYLLRARVLADKGWNSLAVPVQCFAHDGDDLSAITMPFAIEAGGAGQVAITNLRIKASGKANVSCADYREVSVIPEPLNEWWSLDWWMPRHEKKLQDIKARLIDLVFIGDSITEGWEKAGAPVWEKFYAKRNAIALGFGGDRTENVLWRLQHGEVDGINPKVVVMMLGTNNTGLRHETPDLIAKGIKRDLDELRQRLPDSKILLLAIFPRDEKPDGVARLNNEKVNAKIASFADNQHIFFLNINKVFLDEQGILSKSIMPDLLHPNEKGYQIWAEAMEPVLVRLLQ
jgi:lysophospholipase L1-like esterase